MTPCRFNLENKVCDFSPADPNPGHEMCAFQPSDPHKPIGGGPFLTHEYAFFVPIQQMTVKSHKIS